MKNAKLKQQLALLVLNHLRFYARATIKRVNPIIIGVTGSAGKTSCRKAITAILRTRGTVKESIHANSESGISLNILGITPRDYSKWDWLRMCALAPIKYLTNRSKYTYYVAEMEADEAKYPKNMEYLLSIITPHIGVYVSAGVVHSAGFDQLVSDHNVSRHTHKLEEVIVKENCKMLKALPRTGTAIYNFDQKSIRDATSHLKSRSLTVGKRVSSDLRLLRTTTTRLGFAASYSYQGQVYELQLPLLLEANYASTFGLALAVGASLGVPVVRGIEALSNPERNQHIIPPGRFRLFAGKKNTHIIDSSYNASPDTVSSALSILHTVAGRHRKIVVLGDMRELGSLTKHAHQNVVKEIMDNCDECYLFGKETKEYTLPRLVTANFPVYHFDTIQKLNSHLLASLTENAWVLVKGSQNTILLERVVEALLADKSDITNLCRRGKYWDTIRQNTT